MNAFLRRDGGTGSLFSMVLFLVYLLCSIFTILIGSRVYMNIRGRSESAFYSDTALSYISNKIRQSDRAGAVSVENKNGVSVLVLSSKYNDVSYETWIYTEGGYLRELFSETGSGLGLSDGLPVMEAAPVAFILESAGEGALLTVSIEATDTAEKKEALLLLRSSRESSGEGGGA